MADEHPQYVKLLHHVIRALYGDEAVKKYEEELIQWAWPTAMLDAIWPEIQNMLIDARREGFSAGTAAHAEWTERDSPSL